MLSLPVPEMTGECKQPPPRLPLPWHGHAIPDQKPGPSDMYSGLVGVRHLDNEFLRYVQEVAK